MRIGDLVRHECLCEDIGVVMFLVGIDTCSVYFPRIDKAMTVFIDDLEVVKC